jgi:hypothetical protein
MKFRPLHDRVLVRPLEQDERTTGGIIIPDTAKEKPQQGEVIAVGPGGRDEAGMPTARKARRTCRGNSAPAAGAPTPTARHRHAAHLKAV